MDFKDNNTLNQSTNEKSRPRRHSSRSTVYLIFAVVLFLLSSTILAATILYFDSIQKKKADQPLEDIEEIVEETFTRQEVDNMISEAVDKATQEASLTTQDYMKHVLRTASEEPSGVLFLLREYFSDYVIFAESGSKYGYYPIDKSLKPLEINLDNLFYDEDNARMVYMKDGVNVSSHMGIDVSSHQKNIDWKKVKESGVDFAFIRCGFRGYGSGKLVEDDFFVKNISGAIENGVKVGVYFYSQAVSEEEAIEEANYTLELLAPYRIELPIVIDIEEVNDKARTDDLSVEERTNTVVAFCETIKKSGYEPMIYSNMRFFIKSLDVSKLDDYEKWYAMYNTTIYYPYDISVWQYSANGRVDGISGDVDLNISLKDWVD
ncbi:MAG: glycoside hydrolase family 25 protein [Lachnospiraceae bacterium]|nr:glycoside hydrolase family 25 protein [Lachnospiraceae bacterium]